MNRFVLHSDYKPAGDQPEAIDALARGLLERNERYQTLQGVTGSGKTFTIAGMIERVQRPTLVISHNKTLAAQLYSELKGFFPENAVEYFVSYYDYYQPEAYIPATDTYIAKDSAINDELERLRLAAAGALLERRDVIVVSSVSCLYGMGDPEEFASMEQHVVINQDIKRDALLRQLVGMQYTRNDVAPTRGQFRATGDTIEVYLSHREDFLRIEFWGDSIERMSYHNAMTRTEVEATTSATIFPCKMFVMPQDRMRRAVEGIKAELVEQVKLFEDANRLVEAQRIHERTKYDIEMLLEIGYCPGIENYSRHLAGRAPGSRPFTLLDYFPKDYLTVVDESHVTLPQLHAMQNADRNRKLVLVDNGFRLPSALDNRPLTYDEFEGLVGQQLYVSATPGDYELEQTGGEVVEQVVRPTGLLDPPIDVRPIQNQIDDLLEEIRIRAEKDERVLVTTLTKRMAEELEKYLTRLDIRTRYIHSDVDTLERVEILDDFKAGRFDVLVGVNLLREGLDLPSVSLVAILDADKEGFLRSDRSLTQTAGRAARNVNGRVIMYADKITESMQTTIDATNRRRAKQMAYNEEHGIVPTQVGTSARSAVPVRNAYIEPMEDKVRFLEEDPVVARMNAAQLRTAVEAARKKMESAAAALDFLEAARWRDEMRALETIAGNRR